MADWPLGGSATRAQGQGVKAKDLELAGSLLHLRAACLPFRR